MNLNDQTAAALKKTRERRGVKAADLSEAMDLSLDALHRPGWPCLPAFLFYTESNYYLTPS